MLQLKYDKMEVVNEAEHRNKRLRRFRAGEFMSGRLQFSWGSWVGGRLEFRQGITEKNMETTIMGYVGFMVLGL